MNYRPRLSNGQPAPLAWQIRLLFLNISWPIEENAKRHQLIFKRFLIIAWFIMLGISNEAELHFVVLHLDDIGVALEGLSTYLILVETHLRIFDMVWHERRFREVMQQFFQRIYIEPDAAAKVYAAIQRNLLPTKLMSFSYIITLLSYYAIPLYGFLSHQRLLPFKMLIRYDLTQLHVYLPWLLLNVWLGVAVVSQVAAEPNLLAMLILHLNARYTMLQRDIRELHRELRSAHAADKLLPEFRRRLIAAIRRNGELNEFAAKLQAEYSFRIFVMMALSAVLLCALGFKAATVGASSKNITYISWILAKVVELLVFGELGSTLIQTTDAMSATYYDSNWESVILHSPNTQENIVLMKLISMAIALNKKPFCLSGLKYFRVSLTCVALILRGAASYFTFLYAFR